MRLVRGPTRKAVALHLDDPDLLDRYHRILAVHEPYEIKLTDLAIVAHELGERGADETEIDLESLERALS